ncbi:MAG: carboxypeptidase-like regulatory domain-containing protein, partial [Paludibacter sp.]|nr:carboxypeptidase-like regulatory domain-containing protein [Paludibacter sp.]
MKAARTIILLSLLLFTNIVFSQTVSQTLKGMVFDSEIKTPLTGATVVVLGTNPLLGTTTDLDGNYKISHVPIGRYNIHISYIGYEPAIVSEILVTSGKEAVINAGLKQSVTQMKEVTVKANSQKDKPINTMASISARSFTVEETRRYAGGIDDPARLVSSFAGVTVGNLQDNAIIIRGNSPKGVSWRLEGVEIPNPNHFAGGNVVGGGFVTIFSSQLLSNSDFFTGAFPAEYGNALAGVFDMKFRNGNNEKRESTVQVGMLGIDVSSEGPFKKGKNASYLFNYRYSTLGLIADLGLLPTQQVPRYQDLSFKLNFPTQKAGVFSFWGIGAIDNNKEHDELDFTKWETDWDRVQYDWNLNTGVLGLTHKMIIGSRSYINT